MFRFFIVGLLPSFSTAFLQIDLITLPPISFGWSGLGGVSLSLTEIIIDEFGCTKNKTSPNDRIERVSELA